MMTRCVLLCALALMSTPSFADVVVGKNVPPDFSVIERDGFTLPEDTKRKIIESGIFDTPYNGQLYNFKVERFVYKDDFSSAKCYVEGKHYKGKPYTYEEVQVEEGIISPPFVIMKRTYPDAACAAPPIIDGKPYSRRSTEEHFLFIANLVIDRSDKNDRYAHKSYYKDFSYEKFSGSPGGFKFVFSGKRDIAVGRTAGEEASIEILCAGISGMDQRIRHKKGESISGQCQQRRNTKDGPGAVSAWDEPLMAPLLYDMGVLMEPIENFPVGRKISHEFETAPIEQWPGGSVHLGGYIKIFIERVK